MLLGMGTVFVGLIALIFITKIMSAFCGKGKKAKAQPAVQAAAPAAAAVAAPKAIENRPQFVAAIAAAIAMQMGTEPAGLRIHSIRQVGEAPAADRQQLVAAMSAAIATEMGTDVEGLRIHSIHKV